MNLNLKEAFRLQNKLQSHIGQCISVLDNTDNVIRIRQTHLRSKVMPEAQDEVVESVPGNVFAGHITELTAFALWLLAEKEKLSAAIREAKKGLDVDVDGETGLNAMRQSLLSTFSDMLEIRSREDTLTNMGYGLKFNAEGNQVTYKCDLKKVVTINFDRNLLKKRARALAEKADAVSTEIDRCLVNTEVAYEAPFDVNESFQELFDMYLAG